jgi:hypothetical protein
MTFDVAGMDLSALPIGTETEFKITLGDPWWRRALNRLTFRRYFRPIDVPFRGTVAAMVPLPDGQTRVFVEAPGNPFRDRIVRDH